MAALFPDSSFLRQHPSGWSEKAQLPELLWGPQRGPDPHTPPLAGSRSTGQVHLSACTQKHTRTDCSVSTRGKTNDTSVWPSVHTGARAQSVDWNGCLQPKNGPE